MKTEVEILAINFFAVITIRVLSEEDLDPEIDILLKIGEKIGENMEDNQSLFTPTSMNLRQSPDKRRLLLNSQGQERLREAIVKKLGRDEYTFEELSELTGITGVKRLDPDTVSKILLCKGAVYRSSLECLFQAMELELRPSDYDPKSESRNSFLDWGAAPDISVFYGRTSELAQLEHWIVKDRCRLVALLGIGGIGKTALSVKLSQKIQGEFQYVIWRSLRSPLPIFDLLTDVLQFLSPQSTDDLPKTTASALLRLMEHLRSHRCLLILDNWESLLRSEHLAGHYREEYQDYRELIRLVGESPHHSCLVLVSREQPTEIAPLIGRTRPVRSLRLTDLEKEAAQEILREKGLSQADKWGELIKIYRGNPLSLYIVAATIIDIFDGDVCNFIKQNTIYLGQLQTILEQQFNRLSDVETQIMRHLANSPQAISLSQLREELSPSISMSQLMAALESLKWRSLMETITEKDKVFLTLQPVVMKYTINFLNIT